MPEKTRILSFAQASPYNVVTASDSSIPIACTLTSKELADRRQRVIKKLFQKAIERRELEDGFEFAFAASEAVLAELFEFVTFERQCCQFLTFELAFDLGGGPVHLRLRGRDGAKEAIRQIFA
jgi:hypothetical protein